MRPSIFRRIGATVLLALFLPSCTEVAPTSPALIPDGPRSSKVANAKDKNGRDHRVQVEGRGRFITRVSHDIDGKPFARLQYHYRAAPGGDYTLERVTGRVTWEGKTLDVGKHWAEIQAATKARGIRPALMPTGPQAAALAWDCWWEAAALAALSGGLAYTMVTPLFWGEALLAAGAYIEALQAYYDCVFGEG